MFGTIFAINLCNIHSNNVLVQLKQKQKIFRKNFNNRYEYKDISTTYVHLVDICHKLNLNFLCVCVCVCVKRKRSGLLGIFPTFLQFFRQNALFYYYSLSLSFIAYFQQIFSVKLAYRILLDWMPLYYIADTKFPHHDHKFHRVPVFYCKQMVARKWSIHSNVLGS